MTAAATVDPAVLLDEAVTLAGAALHGDETAGRRVAGLVDDLLAAVRESDPLPATADALARALPALRGAFARGVSSRARGGSPDIADRMLAAEVARCRRALAQCLVPSDGRHLAEADAALAALHADVEDARGALAEALDAGDETEVSQVQARLQVALPAQLVRAETEVVDLRLAHAHAVVAAAARDHETATAVHGGALADLEAAQDAVRTAHDVAQEHADALASAALSLDEARGYVTALDERREEIASAAARDRATRLRHMGIDRPPLTGRTPTR